jgi:hypothetical protein
MHVTPAFYNNIETLWRNGGRVFYWAKRLGNFSSGRCSRFSPQPTLSSLCVRSPFGKAHSCLCLLACLLPVTVMRILKNLPLSAGAELTLSLVLRSSNHGPFIQQPLVLSPPCAMSEPTPEPPYPRPAFLSSSLLFSPHHAQCQSPR